MRNRASGISFIVPAYNEEGAIASTVLRLDEALSATGVSYEICVVDDGSRDDTAKRALETGKAQVVRHPTNAGYGRSIKTGIMNTNHPWIGIVDADGTYPIEQLSELIAVMEDGFDMAVAARKNVLDLDRSLKRFFRRLLLQFIQLFVSGRIEDPNSGFRLFSRDLAMTFFPFLCNTFSFTTSITIFSVGEGYFVKYIPIQYSKRVGRTKVRHVRDSLRMAQLVLQGITFFNPVKMFLIMTLLAVPAILVPAELVHALGYPATANRGFLFGVTALILIGLGFLADMIRLSNLAPPERLHRLSGKVPVESVHAPGTATNPPV